MRRLPICLALVLGVAVPVFALTADEQMRFADGIYLRGFHETAAAEYLRLLREFPDSPHVPGALFRTAESYRQMGNQAGAERFYKRVTDEFPQSAPAPRAWLRRVETALADGRAAEARTLLEELAQAGPAAETAAAAAYYRGLSQMKSGERAEAIAAFQEVLQQHGQSPHASYAALDLATLHANLRNQDEQMTAWFEKAVQAAATPSAKAEALFRWGDWAYRQGRYQLATDLLQSLLVELPGERRSRDALLASAWSLYYLDRTEEALERAGQLLASGTDPETQASGTYLRANALRKAGREAEALLDYEAVVRQYPGTAFAGRAAYEIVVTHFQRGDFARALAAAPAQPESAHEADVLWMRAESERKLGRLDLARGRYQTLLEKFPKSAQAAPALLRLGEMAREAGRMAEAADWFGRVAKEHPRNPAATDALRASALARLRAGDADGALADWDVLLARKLDAESAAEARLQKSLALVELQRTEEALAALDALVKDRPTAELAARAHYWRGVLLSERQQWALAEAALRASLAAAPDPQTAALARLRLVVVLQRQDRMDEAADQVDPLLAEPARVAENPALIEWVARRRFEQGLDARALEAATALAQGAREASWRQIGWYWAGASHLQMGDESAARAAFEQAVSQPATTREGAEAQLLLAGLVLKSGRPGQAAELYSAAAAAAGEDSLDLRLRAYFGLGEAAEAAQTPELAARHFMSVAVLFDDPEWTPHSLFRAGHLFGQAGKKAEQAAAWGELAERYPESGFARQLENAAP